jgi:hypothetical protein
MVAPRAIPEDGKAPIVIHLLNRQYDGQNDAIVPQRNFTLRLRRDLLNTRSFAKATLHAPRSEAAKLTVTSDDDYATVQIPSLSFWSLLELSE